MYKFYFLLWSRWALRLTVCSVVLAIILSFLITASIYFMKSNVNIDTNVLVALFDIFKFWFVIVWNFTLLIALYRSLKYIFNNCLNGYSFKLLECNSSNIIEIIGYGDLTKVFRRWLMLLIWFVGSIMIVALILTNLFTSFESVFDWFNIYWLYSFVLMSGFVSFVLLGSRCKRVKVMKGI
ncbi:MAG: hypothetical protein U9N02_06675 [Campylobacterota bacterium]|nr:hypothetical protein [Campylobacterota bacterium]